MSDYKNSFKTALLEIDRLKVDEIAKKFIAEYGLESFLEELLLPVLDNIGSQWEHDTVSLSQVYMSGKICEEITNKYFSQEDREVINTENIAIVSFNTNQSLGKTIVSSLLKGYGYKILDYGYGVETDELVTRVVEDSIDILLVSVLMLPSAMKINHLVERLSEESPKTKVLVGGAPFRFDENLWKEVNADAMGDSVREAHSILQKWMEVK